MKRNYTQVKLFEEEMTKMRDSGCTQREIAEHFGFKDKEVVREFFKRERRKEEKIKSGIEPKRRGRPRTRPLTTDEEKDREIKRLTMENELLRDFLRLAGRR